MSNQELDFDKLREEIRQQFTQENGYWMERLLHTHVGNPVAALYTQVEIIQRALELKPEMVPGEVASLKERVRSASDNIVLIVKALAAAFPKEDTEESGNDTPLGDQ